MTLRLRLIVLLTVLHVGVFLAAAAALLSNTRSNVGAEAAAAANLVRAIAPEAQLSAEQLISLRRARHLRVDNASPSEMESAEGRAPEWFARLVMPDALPSPIPVSTPDGRQAWVRAVPEDEISEAWKDLAGAGGFALVLLAALVIGTSFIVSRELKPLELLAGALQGVEKGTLDTRLPHAPLPEIDRLCTGFNRMAEALDAARRTNRALTRRMLSTQEEERRSLARELHDEFGQHLTAIRANSAVLFSRNASAEAVAASGRAIEQTSATMMRLLRSMLERLRPEALDSLGLCAALEDLVGAFRVRSPDAVVSVRIPQEVELDDERAIVLFRVAQEALTNITRHAHARRVTVFLRSDRATLLEIADDGQGMAGESEGFGLLGMRERVESCGGALELSQGIDHRGVMVRVSFPG